jgi:hypothetical protein
MLPKRIVKAGLALLACAAVVPLLAQQQQPDPAALIAAQKEAMGALKAMDGVWRGPSWILLPTGEKRESVQTERIGPFLDGAIKVIEGKGYGPDGNPRFNAFGIISYSPATRAYNLRSYAQGQVGDFKFEPTADGYTWEIPAGPVTIRYTATIKDGTLREVGDRIQSGKDPVRFFEMTLKRVGDTDWPAAGAIPPK